MESSLTLYEAQETDNLIQPHDHQVEIITFMENDVYKAAEKGEINPAIEQRKDRLHSLQTPQKNTILHIYLTSKTSRDPEPEINKFMEAILGFCPPLLMQVNKKGETPLHVAARYGHASIVKQLIKHAKENHRDDHNQDHESRGAEAVKKMLRMASKEGDTALHEAVRFQHLHVVKILISEDCDFKHNANNSGETPLYMAVERGYNLIAEAIIEHCNSPASGGPTGRNVLHAATIRKDKGMIDYILNEIGEQMLKQPDQEGWTPLHHAAYMGYLDAVEAFLTKEMGREAAYMKNRDGNTALHLATVSKHRETMREIIERCPDSSELVNNRGWNILHFAVRHHNLNLLMKDVLQSRGSLSNLINEKDAQGNTPLHHIAVSINHSCLSLIDDPRVDKLAYNNENENALDLASTPRNLAVFVDRFIKRLKTNGIGPGMRISPTKNRKQDKIREREAAAELKKVEDANVIVAALIATVTFAAGFTIPGGYVSETGQHEGSPRLGGNSAFKTFMVMDTIAMFLSTSSVLIHLYININKKLLYVFDYTLWSLMLTVSAMLAMVVAFATGTYAMFGYCIEFSIVISVLALFFLILFVCLTKGIIAWGERRKALVWEVDNTV
ncbi:hypothetical protein FNV43_RR01531 [Rhamnella rubrinervis]|uniref:PGG domain-containing protein n=1 Tax=Rhamnella rubrinervis TaxID=2594499 RepID=A0A8K0MSD2_9ROSA|nr:hypothetical protein FNV43_RR01531 [Rhamnella rubrinervis]